MSAKRNDDLGDATPPAPRPVAAPPPLPSDVEVPELSLPSPAAGRRRALVGGAALLVVAVALVVGVRSRHGAPTVARTPAPPPVAPTPPPVAIAVAPTTPPPTSPRAPQPAPSPEIALDPSAGADVEAPRHHRRHATQKRRAHEHRHARAERASTKKPAGDRKAARAEYERGNGLLFGNDAGAAVAAYQEAVRRAPSDPIGYRGLGLAYEKEGKTKEAIAALVSYLKLSKHAHDREVIARRLYRLTHSEDGSLTPAAR